MKTLIMSFLVLFAPVSLIETQVLADSLPLLKTGDPMPENLFVELAKLINPAVANVSVSMHMKVGQQYRDPMTDLLEQFMGPQYQPQQREVMSVGTAFVIEPDGLAVTNNHVVENAEKIKVTFANSKEKTYDATVVGRDARTDIALIRIKGAGKLSPVKLGNSGDVQVGQWVAAFGNPYGHSFSMSKGIVSAVGREIRELNAKPFFQTDASINPGNSGGPLVNTHGEVIAVNSAIDARAQGIGFAIPINYVKDLIPQLKQNGRIIRGYLGVGIDDVNPQVKSALKLPVNQGAIVMNVLEGSPADKSGIQAYDVITKLGDHKIDSAQELMDSVADTKIGTTLDLSFYREGKLHTVKVAVTEPPATKTTARLKVPQRQMLKRGTLPELAALGLQLQDWSDTLAKKMKLSSRARGPVVVDLDPEGIAAISGLRVGDVVLDVNRKPVKTSKDVARALQAGNNLIRVQNGAQVSLVFLSL